MTCKDCNHDCNQGRKCPVPHDSKFLALVLTAVILVTASLSILFYR